MILHLSQLKKHFTIIGVALSLLLQINAFAAVRDVYAFSTPAQHKQFKKITQQLRCMVCQNQTLADSQAPLAKDLRQDIYQQVRNGKNDAEIMNYVVSRYGDFVLYTPPLKKSTYALWFLPLFLLVLAVASLISVKLRAQKLAKAKDE